MRTIIPGKCNCLKPKLFEFRRMPKFVGMDFNYSGIIDTFRHINKFNERNLCIFKQLLYIKHNH